MAETVIATDGTRLPLNEIAQSFTYSGAFVTQITVQYQGKTFWQLFDNDGSHITYISNWLYVENPASQNVMITETGEIMLTEDNQPMLTE